MKKIILLVAAIVFTLNTYAQDAMAGKWQARLRVISVLPDVGDDLDGADVDISNAFVPELDFTYFFTDNIAAELILGTTKHDVEVPALGDLDLGEVWLLPPTLNVQYHFMPTSNIRPYAGAGINYTIFYGEELGTDAFDDIEYDNAVGFSFQAGLDYDITEKLFLNLDIKKLLLTTDVTLVAETNTPVEVDINPWIIGLGVGMRL